MTYAIEMYFDKETEGIIMRLAHKIADAGLRTNRVYPGKSCGIVVDYVNVFGYMKKALSQYAVGNDGTVFPTKKIDKRQGNVRMLK